MASVLSESLVVLHDGSRVFPSASPHGLHIWAEAELGSSLIVYGLFIYTDFKSSQRPVTKTLTSTSALIDINVTPHPHLLLMMKQEVPTPDLVHKISPIQTQNPNPRVTSSNSSYDPAKLKKI